MALRATYFLTVIYGDPVVEKFKRNFGLIQKPNELATDYSYSFSLF